MQGWVVGVGLGQSAGTLGWAGLGWAGWRSGATLRMPLFLAGLCGLEWLRGGHGSNGSGGRPTGGQALTHPGVQAAAAKGVVPVPGAQHHHAVLTLASVIGLPGGPVAGRAKRMARGVDEGQDQGPPSPKA